VSDNSKNPRGERRFITDYGETLPVVDATTGAQLEDLPRYGVWGPVGDRFQLLETHNDLARMQQEHGVPGARIVQIRIRPQASGIPTTPADEAAHSIVDLPSPPLMPDAELDGGNALEPSQFEEPPRGALGDVLDVPSAEQEGEDTDLEP
jgi:hypothetical protein